MERNKARRQKRSPAGLTHSNQNTIVINTILKYFLKIWKKYNEIQLTENKMDLNNRKITYHPPSPANIHANNECQDVDI